MEKIAIEKKIEKTEDDSCFFIASCIRLIDGTIKCCGIKNIENGSTGLIELNNHVNYLIDSKGNIIYELNKNTGRKIDSVLARYIINYAKENNIIITQQGKDGKIYQTLYIHYVLNNINKKILFDKRKGGELISIEKPSEEQDTLIIYRKNKNRPFDDMRLFSPEKGKFISPSFSEINKIKGSNVLRFDDVIESDKEENKKRYKTTLTGFIRLDGIMNNTVYDSEINEIREFASAVGRHIEGYKIFRNKVKKELDYKFEEELQKERKMKKFEEKTLTQLAKRKVRN